MSGLWTGQILDGLADFTKILKSKKVDVPNPNKKLNLENSPKSAEVWKYEIAI